MYRLHLTALAALTLLMAGAASAAPKAEKKDKPASAKPAIMECCAKGGCGNCEIGNSAFFTEHACGQCALGVVDVAKHSRGDEHTILAHGNAAFFTATACSAKEESAKVAAEKSNSAPKASKTRK